MANAAALAHPKYRSDIDGLRGVAVLSVVAFHAFPDLVPGGFSGVDVFFVISGYLISTIIAESLAAGTFRFTGFYARRIRRIFPALLVVLVTTLILGWISLFPDEFRALGKHVAAGAGFVSNLVLWRESGYFDAAAETKPLLHLWSLGIEEQFYIAWPLLLWAGWKLRLPLAGIAFVLAAISFGLDLAGVHADKVATFYSPQTRIWELLCGSLLTGAALYRKPGQQGAHHPPDVVPRAPDSRPTPAGRRRVLIEGSAVLGLVLLGLGFWRLDRNLAYPGAWAIFPVAGAMLLISAGKDAWANRAILSSRMLVGIGLISFPLYLWHWPLLSFARIVESGTPDGQIRVGAVALSIALAWITYRAVEKPLRTGGSARIKVAALAVAVAATGTVAYAISRGDGLPGREVVKANASIDTGGDGGDGGMAVPGCGVGDEALSRQFANCLHDKRGPARFALLGDSKSAAMFAGIMRTSRDNGRWLFIGGNGPNGPPLPVISNDPLYEKYQPLARGALRAIAGNKDIEDVVLVAATRLLFNLPRDTDIDDLPASPDYPLALEGLAATVALLKDAGKKVVLVVDTPTLPHPQDCLHRRTSLNLLNDWLVKENANCTVPLEKHLRLTARYRQMLEQLRQRFPDDVRILDTTDRMCDVAAGTCRSAKDGRFLYSYTDHVSDFASGLIGADLNRLLGGP